MTNNDLLKRLHIQAKWLLCSGLLCLLGSVCTPSWAQGRASLLPDFTELVERAGTVVVNISSTQRPMLSADVQAADDERGERGFDFLRRLLPPGSPALSHAPNSSGAPGTPNAAQSIDQEILSLGSGFIISADGLILTNAHVVDGASEVLVRLSDHRELRARVLGRDRRTDIALIKIDALGLPTARLADPNQLKVGEWVMAIGSPFGFDNSVTVGIVSAKGRALPQESYVSFIQTDAAINPGNSGGPLFNLRGEVVGVNSQIYSRSGGNMGLAFAVPIDLAMDIQEQLKTQGRVSRGRIGVIIRDVTREFAEAFALIKPQGALIDAVEKAGPADLAGVLAGDVVLRVDGQLIRNSAEFQRLIGNGKPGRRAQLQLWRNRRLLDVSVQVTAVIDEPERRSSSRAVAARAPVNQPLTAARLGLRLQELSSAQKHKWSLDHGLLLGVVSGAAAEAGLRSNDVVLSLIVRGVSTDALNVNQFAQALAGLQHPSAITLRVVRAGNPTFVSIKTESSE